LPTTEYKLIQSTITQTWEFTKFTFPNANPQSDCYNSLTYSSPNGFYTIDQGAGYDKITLTPTYKNPAQIWTDLTHTLEAKYSDGSHAASATF